MKNPSKTEDKENKKENEYYIQTANGNESLIENKIKHYLERKIKVQVERVSYVVHKYL